MSAGLTCGRSMSASPAPSCRCATPSRPIAALRTAALLDARSSCVYQELTSLNMHSVRITLAVLALR